MLSMNPCNLCPRNCGVNRAKDKGFCQSNDKIKIARAALHFWEEPCISGKCGSGTVFFSGCTLRCCYCQNYKISSEGFGKEISIHRLAEIFLELQEKGAHNINLVTATHYITNILKALDLVKHKLKIPIVYNCSGYERLETINELREYIDVYLPDLKYFDSKISHKYSLAINYFDKASKAIIKMIEQTDGIRFDEDGIMQKGVVIRHLVLPGGRKDSILLLKWIVENLPKEKYLLSLMSQYTPVYKSIEYKEINRRVTTFEYQFVVEEALKLGLATGFVQEKSSAKREYTPPFDLEGT